MVRTAFARLKNKVAAVQKRIGLQKFAAVCSVCVSERMRLGRGERELRAENSFKHDVVAARIGERDISFNYVIFLKNLIAKRNAERIIFVLKMQFQRVAVLLKTLVYKEYFTAAVFKPCLNVALSVHRGAERRYLLLYPVESGVV